MILTVCGNADLLSIMILVNKTLNVLRIIAPVGLIIFASLDVLKAVMAQKQDDVAKKLRMIPTRITAAIIVFFIPTIIQFVMNIADNSFEYASCFTNATEEFVEDSYTSNAYEAVTLVESTLKRYDYDDALLLTNKVKNEEIKATLKARLAIVLEKIKANNASAALAAARVRSGSKSISTTNSSSSSSSSSSTGSQGPVTNGNVTYKDSNDITRLALSHVGLVYVWGGQSWSTGVDCSGFVSRVMMDLGIMSSRIVAADFRNKGCAVNSLTEAKAGDVLVYGTRHVAIYLGEDTTGTTWRVHASGSQSCNGKTATNCQVKVDTGVAAVKTGEDLYIRRLRGSC